MAAIRDPHSLSFVTWAKTLEHIEKSKTKAGKPQFRKNNGSSTWWDAPLNSKSAALGVMDQASDDEILKIDGFAKNLPNMARQCVGDHPDELCKCTKAALASLIRAGAVVVNMPIQREFCWIERCISKIISSSYITTTPFSTNKLGRRSRRIICIKWFYVYHHNKNWT